MHSSPPPKCANRSDGTLSECTAVRSLFAELPEHLSAEQFDELFCGPGMRIERIVSTGQTTPPGQWYDQDEDEWVLLLRGATRLRVQDDPQARVLQPGDYVHLPAHCRHRVEWTDTTQPTVWLAIFCKAPEQS